MKYLYKSEFDCRHYTPDQMTDDVLILRDNDGTQVVHYAQELADDLAKAEVLIEKATQRKFYVSEHSLLHGVLIRQGYPNKRVRIQAKVTLELVEVDEKGIAVDEQSYMDRSKYIDALGNVVGPTVPPKPTQLSDVEFSDVDQHVKDLNLKEYIGKKSIARTAFTLPNTDDILADDAHRRGVGIYDGDES